MKAEVLFERDQEVSMGMLAQRAVEVGEAHNLLRELNRLLGKTEQLTITVDSSAIEETINKAMKDLAVLGEVNRVVLMPQNGKSIVDQIESAHRIAFNAQFTRKDSPERYREALLLTAALAVKAVKLFDSEREHEQLG